MLVFGRIVIVCFVLQADFILMCNNAMTYNAPETVYYVTAKRLLSSGLQIIAKVGAARLVAKVGAVRCIAKVGAAKLLVYFLL